MSFEQRVTSLGLTLPAPPKPVATYVPSVRVGDLLFISGVVPSRDGQIVFQGKVGRDLSKEEGYEAAKGVAAQCIGQYPSGRGFS